MKSFRKIAGIIVSIVLFGSHLNIASAQVPSDLAKNYGGIIVSIVLPSPACPISHALIFDFTTNTPMGVATVFGSRIHMYGNLVTPGTFVVGNGLPVPIPCLLPYPIYPIIEIGTS